jgi:lipoate-protein ligase A
MTTIPPAAQSRDTVPVLTTDAAGEQAWNEARMAAPVLAPAARLWRYPEAAVVLGRSQQSLGATLPATRLPVVVRRAGGGAVLVGPWLLGASIVLPTAHPLVGHGSIADSYRWLGESFVRALSRHGIDAFPVPPSRTWKSPPELAWACYAGMSPWEVAIGERKLVGFAQRRGRHGVLLVAGALLAPVPWELLAGALQRPAGDAERLAAATVAASAVAGPGFAPDAFAASVGSEVAAVLG